MSKINSRVSVEILRDGKIFSKYIRIEELPSKDEVVKMRQERVDKIEASGISVSDIDENIKRKLNIYGGVKIDGINKKQLQNSDLQINDIITRVNNESIYNTKDFQKRYKELV